MSYFNNTLMHINEHGGLSHELQLDLAKTCDDIEAHNTRLLLEMQRIKDAYVPPAQLTERIHKLECMLWEIGDIVDGA